MSTKGGLFKGGDGIERKPQNDSVPDTQEAHREGPNSMKRRHAELRDAFLPPCPRGGTRLGGSPKTKKTDVEGKLGRGMK